MAYQWQGKVVLATGAANGIGAGLVRLATQEKAKHIAIIDVNKKSGDALEKELNAKHGAGSVKFYECDVTNDEQLFAVYDSVVRTQGTLDVVLNNAAIMNDSPNAYRKEIAINVTALVTSTLKALALMRVDEGGKGGTIINISSIAGLMQTDEMPIYFATKSAVIQFSNCIGHAEYYKKTGVRVLTVCFGATRTGLVDPENLGSLDKKVSGDTLADTLLGCRPVQSLESAAKGVLDAFKSGKSGSTWLATQDLPVREITENITRGYQIMGEHN